MRRRDRAVDDLADIFAMLNRCDTVRIAFQGDTYPYVVPVSFGAEMRDDHPTVYFHCAREGLKLDLLRQNPRVCVEADRFLRTEPTDHGITTRYESVIGFGVCELLTDPVEILRGLKLLTEHYGYPNYDLAGCRSLEHLYVGRIVLERVTGKRNVGEEKSGSTRKG